MVNFGPLTPEIDWRVLDIQANFNRFRVLASLLHRRRSTEINQTLHDVWPSPGLAHYIYIYILPGAKFTLRPSIAFSCIGSVTARQSRSWRQPNFAACYNFLQGMELTNFRSSSFSRPGAKAPINEFRQLSWKIHCKWNK